MNNSKKEYKIKEHQIVRLNKFYEKVIKESKNNPNKLSKDNETNHK